MSDLITPQPQNGCVVVHTDNLPGYPHADARLWAQVKDDYRKAAKEMLRRSAKFYAIEILDDEDNIIDQMEAVC